MTIRSFPHFLVGFARGFFATLLAILLLVAAAVAWLGYTATGNRFLADRIAAQVSTPDMQLSFEGPHGLLDGRFHIDRVTVADTKGEFARIEDVDLYWSPWGLLGGRFHAERVAAAKVVVSRKPVTTIEAEASDQGFSLPVEIKIDSIDMPVIALGADLAGRPVEIALAGAATAVADLVALDVTASETRRPEAIARAKLAYAVNAGTLMVDGTVSEPRGGVIATLLALPGLPPVDIAVKGSGPLAGWAADITARVDGREVVRLSGRHTLAGPGLHDIALDGGGELAIVLPPGLRGLFSGTTDINLAARLGQNGLIEIRKGTLANDGLAIEASGVLDPGGDARLSATLRSTDASIPLVLPLATGDLKLDIGGATLSMTGPFRKADIAVEARLARIDSPSLTAGEIVARGRASGFDLATRTGNLAWSLDAATLRMADPTAAKLIQGPVRLKGNIPIAAETISLGDAAIESARLGGTLTATYARRDGQISSNFNLFVLPQDLLPPALAAKITGTIGLSGEITAAPPSKLSVRNLRLTSNLLTAVGSASYDGSAVKADIAGRIAEISALQPEAKGPLDFTLQATGPTENPVVAAHLSSPGLTVAGRTFANVDLAIDNLSLTPAPAASLVAKASLNGQPMTVQADARYVNGQISLPSLRVAVGTNTLTGALALDQTFMPSGKLDFDFPDVALLAAIAGQQADGALKGAFDLATAGGQLSATVKASGPRLAAGGIEVTNPRFDLASRDVLALRMSGTLSADRIASGNQHLDKVALDVSAEGPQIAFDLSSSYDAAPLLAQGQLNRGPDGLSLTLSRFSASPRAIAVALARPATIAIRDSAATLEDVTLKLGEGTVSVTGTAGQTLDLQATIENVPLALADAVVKDLDAAGTLSGGATVSGPASAPVVSFDAQVAALATRQTSAAGFPALTIAATGRFAGNVLTLDAKSEVRERPLAAAIEARLDGGTIALPAIRLQLGKTVLSGNLALDAASLPSGTIAFDIPDAGELAAIVRRKAEGAIKGTADITSAEGAISARIAAKGALRGQAVTLAANVVSKDGAVSLPDLKLDVGANTLTGALVLDGQMQPSGSVRFDLPDLALLAAMAGQTAEGALTGTADIQTDAGRIDATITATGTIRRQSIDIALKAISDNGAISLPTVKLTVGANTLTGALALDQTFMPSGKLDFDFPDVALLAAIAGQQADGALKGALDLATADGRVSATVKANGPRLAAGGIEVTNPRFDLASRDVLAQSLSGTLSADRIASGNQHLDKVALDISAEGPQIAFDLSSSYDAAPLLAQGQLNRDPEGLSLTLSRFSASPRAIAVALARPTTIAIRDSAATLEDVTLKLGEGTVSVTGTAGQTLDLQATIENVPLALVNAVVKDLDAAGTLSGGATISGPASAPVVSFDAQVAALATRQTGAAGLPALTIAATGRFAGNVLTLDAKSEVRERPLAAAIEARLDGGTIALPAIRLQLGKTVLSGNLALDAASLPSGTIAFDIPDAGELAAIVRRKAEGAIKGTADITSAEGAISARIAAKGALRGQAVTLAANVVSKDGAVSLPDLKLDVGANTLTGALVLDGQMQPSGSVRFDLPDLALLAAMAGQTAEGALTGTADIQTDAGRIDATITATGTIRRQSIDIALKAISDNGAISLPTVKLTVGANTLTGALALDQTLMPSGKLDFDFPDVALLAAIAGQQADGALKGALDLATADGRVSATVKANGPRLAAGGIEVTNPRFDLASGDVLAQRMSGTLSADRIASGNQQLDKVALDISAEGPQIAFDLSSSYDAAPLLAQGQLNRGPDGLSLTLSRFSASPRAIAVALARPATIAIRDSAATLEDVTLKLGEGTISVTGTAGQTLDLQATIENVPLALANAVVKDLDAAGTLSGGATVSGPASAPVVSFDAQVAALATRQTGAAGLPALTIAATGRFAGNVLTLDARSDVNGQPLAAAIEARLEGGAIALPAIRLQLGKTVLSGNLALDAASLPSGTIAFDIPDAGELAAIVGRKAEGAIKGTADITSAEGAISARIAAKGALRGQAITLAANVVSKDGAVSLPDLKLDVGANTLTGALVLDGQMQPSGSVRFDLPDLPLLAAMAGQTAEGALTGTADIQTDAGRIDATIAATGTIRRQSIDIALKAVSDNGAISLPTVKLTVGANTLTGALALDQTFMPSGKLDFDFPDIALLAAVAGIDAEGALKGTADITANAGSLAGRVTASGAKLRAGALDIVKPSVDLDIADLAAGQISGRVTADRLASGNNVLTKLALDLDRTGNETAIDLKGIYDGAPLAARATIAQENEGLRVALASFSASPKKIAVKLARPTEIIIRDGSVTIPELAIAAGSGTILVKGTAGQRLDLTARVTALPASLANAVSAGLDATGTISGSLTAKGTAAAPSVTFDARWQNAATAQTRAAGLAALSITSRGQLAGSQLSIETRADGANGLSLTADGTVRIDGNQALAIKVRGRLPFAAFAGQLAAAGVDLKGDAAFDLTVSGSAANPAINGRVTTSAATLTAIRQNLTVNNLAARIDLDGRQARIANLSGRLSGGGTVSVTGTVGIAAASGFPADLKIVLADAVYTDGKIVAAKVTGDLGLTGSLLRGPVLNGRIRVARADITIPEKLPGTLAQLKVKHKNAPADVLVQSKAIRKEQRAANGDKAGGIALDLRIAAPRRIFVRGRGLDAELGGEVTVTGTSNAPAVAGAFRMLRGRLSIIGRRLDFTSGAISFGGDMMPTLDLVASSTVNATTINVTVSGPASNPAVAFTSNPGLPQDEVLALLIFGRSSAALSPVQIAQLADAVATLAGGQSNSLFNKLRQGLGVDDLDIGTDENGKSNVSAGKYLNKRTYLQLQQGVEDGSSKAVINLDIGKGVKLRGEAGTDGSGAAGIFFEKEY
jgi:autotransporter translocation and assembly factor TamB